MRGILFGLVFSNLVYLGWGFMVEPLDPEVVDPRMTRSSDSSVVLVSESPPEALQYYLAQSPEPSLLTAPDIIEDGGAPAQYCAEIGPFENLSDAEGFVGTNASRFAMTVDVRRLPTAPDYRVYLPPFASRELADSTMTALREAFAANGLAIDSFLIPRGELENGIALGLFSEQRNATNVQAQLERLGYSVVIAEEEKFREEVWVLVSGVESEAEFARHWVEIQLSRSYIRAGEKLC
ncbi:MAG: hypothetical protein A3H44_15000 [Gammaproteobacteria bacterium RIFCSPLOWO2_02_FULL_57_10]|nr:MAG: hypothetical protein A3H44_15000 [Gammaproteobacteria bacterium RIFCSPLOWO2_02_FULL_57_10]